MFLGAEDNIRFLCLYRGLVDVYTRQPASKNKRNHPCVQPVFELSTRVVAFYFANGSTSLLPEPACNAMQEFVCASELIGLGYPVSSHFVVEPAGDLDSASASAICTTLTENCTDLAQNGAECADFGDQFAPLEPTEIWWAPNKVLGP